MPKCQVCQGSVVLSCSGTLLNPAEILLFMYRWRGVVTTAATALLDSSDFNTETDRRRRAVAVGRNHARPRARPRPRPRQGGPGADKP